MLGLEQLEHYCVSSACMCIEHLLAFTHQMLGLGSSCTAAYPQHSVACLGLLALCQTSPAATCLLVLYVA